MAAPTLKLVWLGFAIAACVGCRSANASQPRELAPPATGRPPSGTTGNVGGLFFDPQGADFTRWVNHFKNEVYRSWIMPQPALAGFKGHVAFEFTVEREGTTTSLRMLRSSGSLALDRAAQDAVMASRLLRLPAAYGPPRIKMRISFSYNETAEP